MNTRRVVDHHRLQLNERGCPTITMDENFVPVIMSAFWNLHPVFLFREDYETVEAWEARKK